MRCQLFFILVLAVADTIMALGDEAPCCQKRAIIVPILAYCVDFGMPVVLLLASYLYLRHRREKVALTRAASSLPLLETSPEAKPAFSTVPLAPPVVPLAPRASSTFQKAKTYLQKISGAQGHAADLKRDAEARLAAFSSMEADDLFASIGCSASGFSSAEAAARLTRQGPNRVQEAKPPSYWALAFSSLFQPFNALMLTVAIITVCPPNNDKRTFSLVMVLLAGAVLMRFIEEIKNVRTTKSLADKVQATTQVLRDGKTVEVNLEDTVEGDIVFLSGNYLVPGDVRLLESQNLHVGMSTFTGEALPVPKSAEGSGGSDSVLEHSNIVLMGTSVISGSAKAVIVGAGNLSYVAGISAALPSGRTMNAFDYAVRRVVYVFIAFMGVMVPVVIVLSGVSTGSWTDAVALGLSVAVGLSPQMMPMIITANLSRGANQMRKQKTVIRRLDAVQNLGAMDILCVDKTGTLTDDEVVLMKSLDAEFQPSTECLKLGYANSLFQAGKGNVMDDGIKRYVKGRQEQKEVEAEWVRLGEVAFDFERRRLSVILQQSSEPTADSLLICKGACEEVLLKCQHMQKGDGIVPLCEQSMADLMAKCEDMSSEGLRVLALATRALPSSQREFGGEDEAGMLFKGFLVFLDPPKASALPAIAKLHDLGIKIKVLTGDNMLVAKRVCEELEIPTSVCVMGSQLALLEDDDFVTVVEQASIFAKVTPQQKMAIVATLQKENHICGFMGDGTNDGLALRKADVGICVDSGTDVAKDASDMIMLDKDLEKIAQGVAIGRITYGNTVKYIKFASSSSFGNTFSILAGAAWLPFNPLAPIQVLALNLLYNISQMAIPWDTMDPMFVKLPKRWSAKSLAWYMLCIGPTSSIFDITTFLIAWYVFKANNASDAATATFTTIWFLESLMTQTFIVHLLRTERIPFIQSRAAWPLMVSSFGTMGLGFAVCYLPKVNHALDLVAPPPLYYAFLVVTVAVYCLTVQVFKHFYIRVFRSWL